MSDQTLMTLAQDVNALRTAVATDAAPTLARWQRWIDNPAFAPSAANLAHCLALRHHDLRDLQRRMLAAGLSSLGHAESRVMPTLDAIAHLLARATRTGENLPCTDPDFFAGEARIADRAATLLGPLAPHGAARLMVSLPSEAADHPAFIKRLAGLGVEAVRINCARDDETKWGHMIAHVIEAAGDTGPRMKIVMNLPGPKIRTGACRVRKHNHRLFIGDDLAVTYAGQLDRAPCKMPAVECTLSQALAAASSGHRIWLDDGKLQTTVKRCEPWGVVVTVTAARLDKGYKLKPEKGAHFPDSEVQVDALTGDARKALPFVARYADAITCSFVQDADDVAQLQDALAQERPDDWQRMGLILKIETRRALRNFPDIVVRAAGRQPTAVIIARGDLALKIGFARLAEMQEELLWRCKAAQVPVIWATQVLDGYLKTGVPSRGEMTDAAMAARAECLLLNKGPFLIEGIEMLDSLLGRMSGHVAKKAHPSRRLHSW